MEVGEAGKTLSKEQHVPQPSSTLRCSSAEITEGRGREGEEERRWRTKDKGKRFKREKEKKMKRKKKHKETGEILREKKMDEDDNNK